MGLRSANATAASSRSTTTATRSPLERCPARRSSSTPRPPASGRELVVERLQQTRDHGGRRAGEPDLRAGCGLRRHAPTVLLRGGRHAIRGDRSRWDVACATSSTRTPLERTRARVRRRRLPTGSGASERNVGNAAFGAACLTDLECLTAPAREHTRRGHSKTGSPRAAGADGSSGPSAQSSGPIRPLRPRPSSSSSSQSPVRSQYPLARACVRGIPRSSRNTVRSSRATRTPPRPTPAGSRGSSTARSASASAVLTPDGARLDATTARGAASRAGAHPRSHRPR